MVESTRKKEEHKRALTLGTSINISSYPRLTRMDAPAFGWSNGGKNEQGKVGRRK